MKSYFFIAFLVLGTFLGYSQKTIAETIARFNTGEVNYITVEALKGQDVVLLDTREQQEFVVSHLKDAQWVGFETFDINTVTETISDKETPIVVYCSVGVRSEKIGKQLQDAGYTNIKNLYGGIFQWVNEGNEVVDPQGEPTQRIHAYSKAWGKLVTKGKKVYTKKN